MWAKYRLPNGYGRKAVKGKWWLAHRYYYTIHTGPIPAGLHIDHHCNVRECVNPTHLEAVTKLVNNRRQRQHVTPPEDRKTPVRLSLTIAREIRAKRAEGWSIKALLDRFGMCEAHCYEILAHRVWAEPTATL